MWEQLNRIMQERNLNGNQLSKMSGVNRSFFSDLKTGKVKYLSWPNICKIADALEISLDEFRQEVSVCRILTMAERRFPSI